MTQESPSLSTLQQKITAINAAYSKLERSPYTLGAHEALLKIGQQAALLCKDVSALTHPDRRPS